MRIPHLVVLLSTLLFASLAIAQFSVPVNSLEITADGSVDVNPDTGLLQFDIISLDKNSASAYARLTKATDAVRNALKAQNIDAQAAQLAHFSVDPQIELRGNNRRKVVAYKLSTHVTLNIKDFNKIGPLMEALSNIDEVDNQVVTYTVTALDDARKLAVQNGQERARDLADSAAKNAGRSVASVLSMAVDTSTITTIQQQPPLRTYSTYNNYRGILVPGLITRAQADQTDPTTNTPSYSSVSDFGSRTVTVTAHVNALFALK